MFFDHNSNDTANMSTASSPQSPQNGLPLSRAHKTTLAAAAALPPAQLAAGALAHSGPITPPTTEPSTCSHEDAADTPSRQNLISQAIANAAFLYPLSAPTVITSKDSETHESRVVLLSTNPTKILFQQSGTSTSSLKELLQQTETAVHVRLETLNPEVEGLRSAADTARLQRENKALLESLEAARGPFQLSLPTRNERAVPALAPAPTEQRGRQLARSPPLPLSRLHNIKPEPAPEKSLTPVQLHHPHPLEHKTHLQSGLPKSRSSRLPPTSVPPTEAPTEKTELQLPAIDAAELVSPRTIPKSRGGLKLTSPSSRWGLGDEADDVAAWIADVAAADELTLTPPLTPPPRPAGGLPKSRRFETSLNNMERI